MAWTGIFVFLAVFGHVFSAPIGEAKCATDACVCLAIKNDVTCESVSDVTAVKQFFSGKPKSTVDSITITNIPNLKTLPEGIFGQVSTKNLVIGITGLEKIEDGALKGSEDLLETLVFNQNHITKFNFNSIRQLKKLSTFELTNDGLSELPADALTKQPFLTYISLANNSISTINKNTFADLPSVVNVNLRGNKLTNIGEGALATGKARKPVTFILSANQISQINKDAFKDAKISVLELDDNQLTTLDQSTFEPLLNIFDKAGLGDVRGLLFVKGNPVKCDSSLKWLVEKPGPYKRHVRNLTCKDSGKNLSALKVEDLH